MAIDNNLDHVNCDLATKQNKKRFGTAVGLNFNCCVCIFSVTF